MDTQKTVKVVRITVEEVPYTATHRVEKDGPNEPIPQIVSLHDIPTTTVSNETSQYRIMEFCYGKDYKEPFFVKVGQEHIVSDLFHEFLRRRSLSILNDVEACIGQPDQTPTSWQVTEPWFTVANGKNMQRDEMRLKVSRLREAYV